MAAVPLAAQQAPLRVFSSEERAKVAELVDRIIPRTDTPGASDAHVTEFIDRKLSMDAALKERFLGGLRAFDGILDENVPFCKLLKDMTVDGYYTSKEGLTGELGWHGNTYVADFKGCTHPEHQS